MTDTVTSPLGALNRHKGLPLARRNRHRVTASRQTEQHRAAVYVSRKCRRIPQVGHRRYMYRQSCPTHCHRLKATQSDACAVRGRSRGRLLEIDALRGRKGDTAVHQHAIDRQRLWNRLFSCHPAVVFALLMRTILTVVLRVTTVVVVRTGTGEKLSSFRTPRPS